MKRRFFGFTLAEIMIVLTVIAILTAILLPSARNATPEKNVLKFKKANTALLSAVKGLINSDKYYYNGDFGLKADEELVDDPKYFCNTLADVLSVKSVNCSDDGNGDTLDSIAVANLADFSADELDGEKMQDLADYVCANYTDSGEEIVLSDNAVIYTVKPYYHFGSKFTDASGNEGRIFNLCSKEQRYKWLCVDIDGIGKGEAPFGYALRADGRMFSGSRALAWVDRKIQSNNEETLTISSISSYSPSTPTMIAEGDSCGAIEPPYTPPAPEPEPEPATCTLGEHCTACDDTSGECTECEAGYNLVDGTCEESSLCDGVDCGSLAMCVELSSTKAGCITKFNIGDKTELPIPSTVTTVQTDGTTCDASTKKCCWQGETSMTCDSANGGYSGCNRTLCNLEAAKDACSKLTYNGKTWRLLSKDDLNNLKNLGANTVTRNLGANGLQLCDSSDGYGSAHCRHKIANWSTGVGGCTGAVDSTYINPCFPLRVWGQAPSGSSGCALYLNAGSFSVSCTMEPASAFSTRCISDL